MHISAIQQSDPCSYDISHATYLSYVPFHKQTKYIIPTLNLPQ